MPGIYAMRALRASTPRDVSRVPRGRCEGAARGRGEPRILGRRCFDTFGSAVDTVLYARRAQCTDEVACNDDTGSPQSRIQVDLAAVAKATGGSLRGWTF